MSAVPERVRLPVADDPLPAARAVLDRFELAAGRQLNINRTMAHQPKMLEVVTRLGGFLMSGVVLPPREREIVVLRVGWRCGSVYEFGQHTVLGRAAGLTDDEISRLTSHDLEGWPAEDRLLVTFADELCRTDTVSDATWAALADRYDRGQLVELLILGGYYRMISGFLNAAGVALEDGVPGWPPGR